MTNGHCFGRYKNIRNISEKCVSNNVEIENRFPFASLALYPYTRDIDLDKRKKGWSFWFCSKFFSSFRCLLFSLHRSFYWPDPYQAVRVLQNLQTDFGTSEKTFHPECWWIAPDPTLLTEYYTAYYLVASTVCEHTHAEQWSGFRSRLRGVAIREPFSKRVLSSTAVHHRVAPSKVSLSLSGLGPKHQSPEKKTRERERRIWKAHTRSPRSLSPTTAVHFLCAVTIQSTFWSFGRFTGAIESPSFKRVRWC